MKKGTSIWVFPGDCPLETCFDAASKAGFDGIELALGSNGITEDITEAQLDEVKALGEKYGLEFYSIACGLFFDIAHSADDPEVRAHAERLVKKEIDIAAYLGCDTVLVVPGAVSCPWNPAVEVVLYDVVYARALAAMKKLAPYAESKKVAIGVENVWNRFLLSPMEMRDFIDAVGSPYVGSYFDAGNVLFAGYPDHWVKILGNRIKKVHVKDFKVEVGNLSGFVPLNEGDLDFPKLMASLNEIGYDGWVTAEVAPMDEDVYVSLQKISAEMDEFLK